MSFEYETAAALLFTTAPLNEPPDPIKATLVETFA